MGKYQSYFILPSILIHRRWWVNTMKYPWKFWGFHKLGSPQIIWLVVRPPLWKIWKSIGMISNPIYGKIKNVPNHQPVILFDGIFPNKNHPAIGNPHLLPVPHRHHVTTAMSLATKCQRRGARCWGDSKDPRGRSTQGPWWVDDDLWWIVWWPTGIFWMGFVVIEWNILWDVVMIYEM